MIEKTTGIPIYGGFLMLSVSNDVCAARKSHSDKFGLFTLGFANALASSNDETRDYALFFSYDFLTPGIIAHEIFHVTHRIMNDIRGLFTIENQEPHAYLCEWITNWVYAQLKEEKLV